MDSKARFAYKVRMHSQTSIEVLLGGDVEFVADVEGIEQ